MANLGLHGGHLVDVSKNKNNPAEDQQPAFSVGIVGAGSIVNTIHLPLLQSMPNTSIAWLTDINTGNLRATARAYEVPYLPLPNDVSELPHSDVILLAIPYGVRDQYYEAFRGRPSAMYVEKPFSRGLEHHKKICSWFPNHNLACGFQRRAWGLTKELKKLIDENVFGQLRMVRFGVGNHGGPVGNNYQSDIRLAGGGVLFESGVHGIDTILFCTRAQSVQVDSVRMIMDGRFDLHTEANLRVVMSQARDIQCLMTFSSIQETINGWEFHFENAVASFSFSSEYVSIKAPNGSGTYRLEANACDCYPRTSYQMFYEFWSRFLAGVHVQKSNWTSASQSILTTEVIEKLYEAGST